MKTIVLLLAITGFIACSKSSSDSVSPKPDYVETQFIIDIKDITDTVNLTVFNFRDLSNPSIKIHTNTDTSFTTNYISGDSIECYYFYTDHSKNHSTSLSVLVNKKSALFGYAQYYTTQFFPKHIIIKK